MTKYLIIIGLIIVGIFIFEVVFGEKEKRGYEYRKRNFFMTKAEHDLFDLLIEIFGEEFYIFAQVHLSTLFDHKIRGQNWLGAFTKINQKSVDFVLCDKSYISPKLAIELDDKSHDRQDRIDRDEEVERIFEMAGLPLLRLKGATDREEITQKVKSLISKS